MDDFKFIEEEEENNIANDDSDVQEEGTKQYEEHFWCKAKVVPVGFTYKDFIRASDNIKSNFQNAAKGSPKFMDNLEFCILDCRKKDSGPEMNIETTRNKGRGVAALTFYDW